MTKACFDMSLNKRSLLRLSKQALTLRFAGMQFYGRVGSFNLQKCRSADASEASICRNASLRTRRKLPFAGMQVCERVGSFNLQECKSTNASEDIISQESRCETSANIGIVADGWISLAPSRTVCTIVDLIHSNPPHSLSIG